MLSESSVLGKIARLPFKCLPPGMVLPILRGQLRGRRWIVGSTIRRCWLGSFECEKQQLIARELRPGVVFYDVGANVGFYSLLAASLLGSGKVFAFEPLPRNIWYLKKHLKLNQIYNVEIFEVAVSDQDGLASFDVGKGPSLGRLSSRGNLTVKTVKLDSLIQEGRIAPPDVIKMDIEGAEFEALKGARTCLQTYRPILFLATHGSEVESKCRQQLESWGYGLQEMGNEAGPDRVELVAKFRL